MHLLLKLPNAVYFFYSRNISHRLPKKRSQNPQVIFCDILIKAKPTADLQPSRGGESGDKMDRLLAVLVPQYDRCGSILLLFLYTGKKPPPAPTQPPPLWSAGGGSAVGSVTHWRASHLSHFNTNLLQ